VAGGFAGNPALPMQNAAPLMPRDSIALFELARQAIGTTQEALGKQLGVARRTAQRWAVSGIPSYHLVDLARLVHPHDPALAREVAEAAGTTLEAAGVVQAPPPSRADGVVDAVVCAAAEAMEMTPQEVRPGLHAALVRARELGLTFDAVERALGARLGVGATEDARGAKRGAQRR
jgi:hypothetical protein